MIEKKSYEVKLQQLAESLSAADWIPQTEVKLCSANTQEKWWGE